MSIAGVGLLPRRADVWNLEKKVCVQIIPLDPSNLGLGGREYYSYNDTHPRVAAYKTYMATIAMLLNVTEADSERFIRNTIALEKELAQASKLATRLYTDNLLSTSTAILVQQGGAKSSYRCDVK